MTTYSIDVAADKIQEHIDEIPKAIEKALKLWAMEAKGEAKRDAPKSKLTETNKNSGRLASSIASNVSSEDGVIIATIGTNVEYAPYNEYGTGDRGSNEYNGHVSEGVTFTGGWHGMDPHPYLRPRIYDDETAIIASIADAIRSVFE